MIKQLRIQNIILIETMSLSFHSGFNVISGETGSGKSAIMSALSLILGERADTTIIRKGYEKATVEALFEISLNSPILAILKESGIDSFQEELLIRREISLTGKNRIYINHQLAQLSLLKRLSEELIDFTGQHANQRLLLLDHQRNLLDSYGNLQADVLSYSHSYKEESLLQQELNLLITSETERVRKIESCQIELEELQTAAIQEGEEEALFSQYQLLANADELIQKLSEITRVLTTERQGVLVLLIRLRTIWDQLIGLDPTLTDTYQIYNNALIELQETTYTLTRYQANIECDPEKLEKMNQRLSLINRLKRKYGPTEQDILDYTKQTHQLLAKLENADQSIELLRLTLGDLKEKNRHLAEILTQQRTKAAKKFEKQVTKQLQTLNMPKAEFLVDLLPQAISVSGCDKIEFYLIPNVGENRISLRECASGGELSRVLLAIQTVLTGKDEIPTLVFDEIDANIGGKTANIIGQKLHQIGKNHQIICITHFSQVAQYADHHLQIGKQEVEGRTLTFVITLDETSKLVELARMRGH